MCEKWMQSWKQSCIVFASLYGKTPFARNGNKLEINSRRGKLRGKFLVQIVRNFLIGKLTSYFFPFLGIAYNLISFRGIAYNLYEEFPTNFSTNGNLSLIYFRFWQTAFYRTNWQKRCTTRYTIGRTIYCLLFDQQKTSNKAK